VGLGRTSMRLSHLTLATPYQPGAINRRGKPRSTVLTFGWPISQPLNCPNVEAQMSVSDAVDGSHPTASQLLLLAISGLFGAVPGTSALPPKADIMRPRGKGTVSPVPSRCRLSFHKVS
jgi:hypothetical protein